MLLLDRILTHIVNHISNTSYHLQYLYCQGGYVFGAKPNLITCVGYIFLSAFARGFFYRDPYFRNDNLAKSQQNVKENPTAETLLI